SNRVRILDGGRPGWLTQPVRHDFGQAIAAVSFADEDWPDKHLSRLRNAYGRAPAFAEVWPVLSDIYRAMPHDSLGLANRHLICALAGQLGLETEFVSDADIAVGALAGDDRLIALLRACGDDVSYLSGAGGRKYQDEAKFAEAHIPLVYAGYEHPAYDQGDGEFVAGLSIVDALLRFGWAETARLVAP
ncbi:MAG: WbqC family protein, partial [Alphaproteobacteria bacterium]|nr:WbqC family protein [Alphaproteobacteria bacterium]